MKRMILTLVCGLFLISMAVAQEYKVSKSSGRLEIREVNHVSIEGHNGNEIIFTSTNPDRERDERAKGLRALSSMGLTDNSGLGLSILEKGDVVEVQQLKKTDGPKIKILVPRGVTISYSHASPYGDELRIQNFEGTIEVSMLHNDVELNNVSGPLSVKAVHGNIEAIFSGAPKGAVDLESAHGHVDVALPVAVKANITMRTQWGEILVDPDFKLELGKTGELVNYSEKISSKLNGGGTDISLTSRHHNVYLRKN